MSKILAIGAHFDDVELRCLGTLLKAKDAGYGVSLVVVTNSSKGGENRYNEQEKVNEVVGYDNFLCMDFEDGELRHTGELVTRIEAIIKVIQPDIILTHTTEDHHQDHIAVSKSVLAANRLYNSAVLMFPGQDYRIHNNPNVYVDISEYLEKKKEILSLYKSQEHKKYWKSNQHETESFYLKYLTI